MRVLRRFLLLALISSGIGSLGFAQSKDEVRLSITKDVTEEIGKGQYARAVERFSPQLKESITQDQLEAGLKDLVDLVGPFQKQLSQDARVVEGALFYVSRSQFEKNKVELRFVFDDSDRIDEFYLTPLSNLSADDMEKLATDVTNLLRQQHFGELSAQFNDQLKALMNAQHLDDSWSHVLQHVGSFKSIMKVRKDPEHDAVDVRCEFEHSEIIVRVAFDFDGKVAFIWMLPAESEQTPKDKV
jgi:hypothetical protein